MSIRVLDFSDGFTSETQPSDSVSSSITGSLGSPSLIGVGGFTPANVSDELAFIKSTGGAVDISANPQIMAGTAVGQRLTLIGTSDTDTVLFEDSNGLRLNGPWMAENGSVIRLVWDGSKWTEEARQ